MLNPKREAGEGHSASEAAPQCVAMTAATQRLRLSSEAAAIHAELGARGSGDSGTEDVWSRGRT